MHQPREDGIVATLSYFQQKATEENSPGVRLSVIVSPRACNQLCAVRLLAQREREHGTSTTRRATRLVN
jgi:hypothetical protein